jgi:hypothetical protein
LIILDGDDCASKTIDAKIKEWLELKGIKIGDPETIIQGYENLQK